MRTHEQILVYHRSLGLVVLTANALILFTILNRLPAPPVTAGEWRQKMSPAERLKLHDRLPHVEAFVYIDNGDSQPIPVKIGEAVTVKVEEAIPVKIEDQPIEVHPVR